MQQLINKGKKMRAIVEIEGKKYEVEYSVASCSASGFSSKDDFYTIYKNGEYPIDKTLGRAYDSACDNSDYDRSIGETVEFTNKAGKTVIATVFPN